MDRKHQVFVSSTYRDLIEERQHVIHALLELDCIPSGMELFPAADEDAWTLIKEVIDNCDYYLLIIAGKYGSQNSDGTSYTEMEFNYAVESNKPIITFLHQNIEELITSKTEKSAKLRNKLAAFRTKAEQKHCKYWKNAEDLGGKVSRSLVQLRKRHPSDGWIPGKYAADEKLFRRLEELRARIEELESEKEAIIDMPPKEAESLASGKEIISQPCKLYKKEGDERKVIKLETTWDKLFSYAGSAMIGECTEKEFRDKVQLIFWHSVPEKYRELNFYEDIVIYDMNFDTIKIQLQALGLITHGIKKRTVSDTNTYWKLTPYGEKYLLQVRAIKSEIDVPF